MLYGTDWLAFAHLVLAVAFWGPLRDPVRNVWVVQLRHHRRHIRAIEAAPAQAAAPPVPAAG
ncbi:hypothetical protein [Micromonospora mirobrigensis]|uniref:Uncharacterized protein n=1 Tax=Micromonospora mirobrigensis TaxID=262898 RepID=A0A1C5A9N9_9ACTN|nr:hypothetical protein GA0070564_108176 [Micromonospora mirobrigensis]